MSAEHVIIASEGAQRARHLAVSHTPGLVRLKVGHRRGALTCVVELTPAEAHELGAALVAAAGVVDANLETRGSR